MSFDLGSVDLTKPGSWLVAVQNHIAIDGTLIPDTSGGLPYLTINVSPGIAHGTFCMLPIGPMGAPRFAWSFVHTVTDTTVSVSNPETLNFTGELIDLVSLVVAVSQTVTAIFIAVPTDDGAPQTTSVTVNPGSKLQILRQANR